MNSSADHPLFRKAANGDLAALKELERLATNGGVEATYAMGRLCDVPKKSDIDLDLVNARKWYEGAALRGHAFAQLCIGNMCDYGEGRDQDYAKARRWYEAAAKQNVRDAQTHLAVMLERGRGGYQSSSEAAHWYGRAVELGDDLAVTNLGLMHFHNEVENSSDTEAMRLFLLAAAKMDGLAHLMLARMFVEGRGVARHGKQALLFFCIATLLLPSGKNRELAESGKEELLKDDPDARHRFEEYAREFIEAGGGRLPFIKE